MPASRLAATLATAIALSAAACSSEPPDPAEQRRDRVADRLEDTFSRQQAGCIIERLDDAAIAELDAEDPTAPLSADGDELRSYSDALLACVVGEDAVPERD